MACQQTGVTILFVAHKESEHRSRLIIELCLHNYSLKVFGCVEISGIVSVRIYVIIKCTVAVICIQAGYRELLSTLL